MKTCIKCNEEKPIEDFSSGGRKLNKNGEKYPYSYCRSCQNARNREYHAKNKQRASERNRAWRLKSRFGVSVEWYEDRLAKINGVCEICGKSEKTKSLAVDHDHATGKVRGLLCTNCNTAIGSFMDDLEILKKALIYLENHK